MMLGERPNFGVVNTILNSDKALRDAKQLGLSTTQVFSININSDQVGLNLPIFSVPNGETYTFISASYSGVDSTTRLSVTFPGGLASAGISSAYGFSSFAGPVTEGEVMVNVSAMTPDSFVIINLCFLTIS